MKNSRSKAPLAAVLLVAAGLSACGGGEEPSSPSDGGAPAAVAPTSENVPGTYRMMGSDQYVLDGDGTFTREEGDEVLSSGTWAIEGERIVLTYSEADSGEAIAAGETRTVGLDSRGLLLDPDSDRPMRYPRR